MRRSSYFFTSESVSEGHPDKVCDRISDSVVDAYLAAEPEARVACETLATTNRVVIAGEVRGPASITKDKVIQLLELSVIPSPNVPGEISGISGAFLTFPPASLAATEDPETLGVWGSETRTPPPREEEPHGRKR